MAQRVGMDYVGPFTFNGVRFALGSLSLVPLLFLIKHKDSPGRALVPRASRRTIFWGGGLAGLFPGRHYSRLGWSIRRPAMPVLSPACMW